MLTDDSGEREARVSFTIYFGQTTHQSRHSLPLIQESGNKAKTSQLINLKSNQSSTKA
jgi:hypothetical protein